MAHYKEVAVRRAGCPTLSALAFALAAFVFVFCSQAPENCGDGQKLDTHSEFCFDGKAYKKCGGNSYDPTGQFCSAEKLYDKCTGREYDPMREFCFAADGKVYAKCGGGDEFNPQTHGCFFGSVLLRCGVNFYDPAYQFCQNNNSGAVYDKCNGQTFDPATQGCSGNPAVPKCGTEPYDTAALSCNNNKVYDKCDGQAYNPELGCNGVKARPKCGGVEYDDAQKFCYNGRLYDKCGGQDYDPRKYICAGTGLVSISDVAPPDSTAAKFKVTVESAGTGASVGGSYAAGATVTIRAGTAPAGQQFINWTAADGDVVFAKADTAATTFIMPGYPVTVVANFAVTYQATVSTIGTNASGGGRYPAGATVTVKAGTAPAGLQFYNWTTSSAGVTLSNAKSATTTFTMPANAVTVTVVFAVVDARDQAVYKVATIGNQTWMGQNLNYRPQSGSFWCYQDKEANCEKYGRLYDWKTAMAGVDYSNKYPSDVRGVCPAGWHLPSSTEWYDLVNVPGSAVAGTKFKAKAPDWNGTDDYGFTALLAGARDDNGNYYSAGSWWGGTDFVTSTTGYVRYMRSDSASVPYTNLRRNYGLSVRCVKD